MDLEKLILSESHVAWLETERRIDPEIAAAMGVVSVGKNIGFLFRQNGVAKFVKERTTQNGGSKTYRISPTGQSLILWNVDAIAEPFGNQPVVICEGELDAVCWAMAGAAPVMSVPNGSPFDKPGTGDVDPLQDRAFSYLWQDGKLLPGLAEGSASRIILATDGDPRGRTLRGELSVRLGSNRCDFVTYPDGCKDANEVLIKYGLDKLVDMLAGATPMVPNRLVPFSEIPPEVETYRYPTGWSELDKHLIIWPGLLVVVTGTPGHGKSQWVIALCANLARIHGLRGAILQFEDNPNRNRGDLIAYAKAWRSNGTGGIDDAEAWVDRMFLTISPTVSVNDEDYTLDWLTNVIEEAATRHGCKWVVIDPWNELEHLWGVTETETAYTVKALKYLKTLARRFKITLFVVTHPTKAASQGKDIKAMTLSDVAGSYAWRAKADIGIIVYRADQGLTETHIKIDKSKDNSRYGRPGIVRMEFMPTQATYRFAGHGIG